MGSVHLVGRWDPAYPDAVARALAMTARRDPSAVRVIELFDPKPGAPVVDLCLGERDLAEVVAALHWADEVHVHRVHPDLAVRCLPEVKDDVLSDKTLVVHPPWPELSAPLRERQGRLTAWPGPTRVVEPAPLIDVDDPQLLPRPSGAEPIQRDDGRWLATVALAESLTDRDRSALAHCVPAASRPGELVVETLVEGRVDAAERSEIRRTCQAVVAPPVGFDTTVLEALLQGLPIVMLGERRADGPPDVVWAGRRDPVERACACIRAWGSTWARGEAVPVDLDARRAWITAFRGRI